MSKPSKKQSDIETTNRNQVELVEKMSPEEIRILIGMMTPEQLNHALNQVRFMLYEIEKKVKPSFRQHREAKEMKVRIVSGNARGVAFNIPKKK